MLSRAAILSGQASRALVAYSARTTGTSAASQQKSEGSTANLPRPVRQEPGKVRLGFVPEEWFQMFYKKTGVTGPYVFAFTLSTYLVSKEIYVLEHEFYNGLSLLVMWVYGIKKFGPAMAKWLDKEIDDYEKEWSQNRTSETDTLSRHIAEEQRLQWSIEGQNMLVEAKRENVALQLEANYRERLLLAFTEVKRRLDYQVEKTNVHRRITQMNLVDYVVAKVGASITPDREKQNIDKCIADLALCAK